MFKWQELWEKLSREDRNHFFESMVYYISMLVSFIVTMVAFIAEISEKWFVLSIFCILLPLVFIHQKFKWKGTIYLYFSLVNLGTILWAYTSGDSASLAFITLILIVCPIFTNFVFTSIMFGVTLTNLIIILILNYVGILPNPNGTYGITLGVMVFLPLVTSGYITSFFVSKLWLDNIRKLNQQYLQLQTAQQQIINQEKLKSLQLLAGGLAHDFNNLLMVILGNINLAEMSMHDSSLKSFMKEGEIAAIKASRLVSELLSFSQEYTYQTEPIEPVRLIAKCTKEFCKHHENYTFDIEYNDDLKPIEGNRGQFQQVLRHLFLNAQIAMPKGGNIRIAGKNTTIPSLNPYNLTEGEYVQLEIIDHGTGVDPVIASKMFDPYFAENNRGKGLGLAICHTILANHEGCIQVDSSIEKGTKFSLLIPAM